MLLMNQRHLPAYLDEASVPAEVVEHEKSILAAQMKEDPKMASKPEAVLAKIAAGKMGKYYKENCLVDQEFVRSDLFQGSVKGYVDSVAKELSTEIKLNGFIRMMKGDGLEKIQSWRWNREKRRKLRRRNRKANQRLIKHLRASHLRCSFFANNYNRGVL